jgi:hypothetical protein
MANQSGGPIAMGEQQDITLSVARQILEIAI